MLVEPYMKNNSFSADILLLYERIILNIFLILEKLLSKFCYVIKLCKKK